MPLSRRHFIALTPFIAPLARTVRTGASVEKVVRPARLRPGNVVGLISPGGAIFNDSAVDEARETLAELGLRTTVGAHVLDRRGYLAGTDADRAADLHAMFADPEVDAILAMRGGWGCARILPLVDFDLIRQNPKILIGFSDVTSLLLAIYARAGLVTFHGPVGISSWSDFTVRSIRSVLIDGEMTTLVRPRRVGPPRVRALDPRFVITAGWAEGRLVGGNLSVLVSLLGTGYLPDFRDHVLFLEDTREEPYRIDRMLTQLAQAGVLAGLRAVVFGECTRCEADDEDRSLSLREVLFDHLAPLGIPAWYGLPIGHSSDKLTLPIGVQVRAEAGAGSLQLLESAVS